MPNEQPLRIEAAFVLTPQKIFWSTASDDLIAISREHQLYEKGSLRPDVVWVTLSPPDNDPRRPLSQWIYKKCNDRPHPLGYQADVYESRSRSALEDWATAKLRLDCDGLELSEPSCSYYCVGGKSLTVRSGATAHVNGVTEVRIEAEGRAYLDNVQQVQVDNAYAVVQGESRTEVTALNGAEVLLDGLTVCEAKDSHIYAQGRSTVYAKGYSRISARDKTSLYLQGDSVCHTYDQAVVNQCGSGAIVLHKASTEPPTPSGCGIIVDLRSRANPTVLTPQVPLKT